jgi:hypothetical protein
MDNDIRPTSNVNLKKEDRESWRRRNVRPNLSPRANMLALAATSGLSPLAIQVLYFLQSYSDAQLKDVWPSNKTIAGLAGVSERTIERANAELIEKGWILSKQRRQLTAKRSFILNLKPDKSGGKTCMKSDSRPDKSVGSGPDKSVGRTLPTNQRANRPTRKKQNAAPEIALASTDADLCEDSLFPEGPFVRVRSMTAAERAEPLKVIKRSEVSADEWERLTHPRDYVDDYEIDAVWGEAMKEDSFPALHSISDLIGHPEHPDLSYMALPKPLANEPRMDRNAALAPIEPMIELKTESVESGADVGEAIKKGLEAEPDLYTGAVDNPERLSKSLLMAFPESRVEKSRLGENTYIAPSTKPVLESSAAEKKETQQQPTATPEGTPAVVICKEEERVENSEFQLTNTPDTVVNAKPRKRKTMPAPRVETQYPFATFWAAYPRKHGKAPAEKTWAKLTEAQRAAAIAGIAAYMRDKEGCDKTFIKHGSTYLNQKVWEEYEPDNTVVQNQQALPPTSAPAPISKHAARNARGAEKYPGDPYFGFGVQKLESLLNYRADGFWVHGVINSRYDWWEGEEFEPELVALAKRVESGEISLEDAMDSVRPVAKPLPARPQLRVVR